MNSHRPFSLGRRIYVATKISIDAAINIDSLGIKFNSFKIKLKIKINKIEK